VEKPRQRFIAYVGDWPSDAHIPVADRPFHGHLDPLTEGGDADWARPCGIDDVPLPQALAWARERASRVVLCVQEGSREQRYSAGEEHFGYSGGLLPLWDDS
jgi:hypothetical protein